MLNVLEPCGFVLAQMNGFEKRVGAFQPLTTPESPKLALHCYAISDQATTKGTKDTKQEG